MELLINQILNDLRTELNLTDSSDIKILSSKVRNAYRDVKRARGYQAYHSHTFIDNDMEQFYSNIHDLALYDYNQIGAEGETSHSENGTNRTWKDRKECFDGIVAFCGTP